MKKGDMIFVYGTLLRGERADITKNCLIHSTSLVAPDEINGKLYHIGAFPGVKLVTAPEVAFDKNLPTVRGEVYLIGDQSTVSILDHYESYHDDGTGLYNRFQVRTRGDRYVWVYTYNPPVIDDQLIETGDWKNPRLAATHRIPNIGRH